MSKRTKIAGIYMIRNCLNGKVYIGASKNINKRFSQYRWAVKNTTSTYGETQRDIVKAMRHNGISNFEFIILECGDEYNDPLYRATKEIEYIKRYNANIQEFGYNGSAGGEFGPLSGRKQSIHERLKRSKALFMYNIENGSCTLVFGGAKTIGKFLGYGKDVVSHAVNRGSLFINKYYMIPVNKSDRQKIIDKLYSQKILNRDRPNKSVKLSTKNFNLYINAVNHVENIAKIMGYD